ncbi:MAG: PD40 domain-containing protein [Bacteroidia bacterium]|nr:PD40 domain-containing protein [Bacteroidia bacterium]
MIKRKTILAITLTLGGFTMINAQNKIRKEAEQHYTNKDYHLAAELYAKVYEKTGDRSVKSQSLFYMAECYRHINDLKTAETFYAKAIKAKYTDPLSHFYLGEIRREFQRYDEAIEEYKKYQAEVPSDNRPAEAIKACEESRIWTANPTPHKVENMVYLNSPENDYSPAFEEHKKFNKLLISSNRKGVDGNKDIITGHNHSDIYASILGRDGKWSEPKSIGAPINTIHNDASCNVSRKGDLIYYTHCSEEKGKVLACNIWVSRKSGATWGESAALPFESDTVSFRHPCLSPDGNTLYFASDMAGGYGGHDIWKVDFDKRTKEWGSPVNLGPSVNTSATEAYPFMHDDGKSLYFSSNGRIGMGGLDLFVAEINKEGKFSNESKNLQSPLNSPQDDFGIIFEGKKERGYFTSDREGGKGGDDIWSFVVEPILIDICGFVKEKGSETPVANATILIKGDNGIYFPVKTDATGFYSSKLDKDNHYSVNCETSAETKSHDGKNFVASNDVGKFETFVKKSTQFKKNFELESITIGGLKIPRVLYDFDESVLTQQGKDSLEYLYNVLITNPTIKIELGSHTDTRGTVKHNKELAEKRAQSCVDYLIKVKGIAAERIAPKGWGEDKPLFSDKVIAKAKTEQEKEAMHQANRRTAFRILAWDYVDPLAPAKPPVVLPKVIGEENAELIKDSE